MQTEKWFDLIGGVAFISIALFAFIAAYQADQLDLRSLVLTVLVVVWAGRLSTFLFARVVRVGHDRRFRPILPDPAQLFMTWSLQGLWVTLTIAPALAAITAPAETGVDIYLAVGGAIWLIGFAIEVLADRQKKQFQLNSANEGKFITTGLWSRSRHPNYFGEIVLWIGVAVIAIPTLEGLRFIVLISPIFIYLLLTKISGVRMLEVRANRKWGEDAEYQDYMKSTPMLIPKLTG